MTRHAARHALGYEKHRRAAVWDRPGHWIGATPEAKLVEQFLEYQTLALTLQGSVSQSAMR